MSDIASLVRFEHKATWTIKNFDFRSEKPITSRKFDVMCFDVTSFSLCLHPKGKTKTDYMQFSVRLHYARSHDVPELFLNSVKFYVYVVDEENENMAYFSTESFYVPNFSAPESPAVNFIRLKDFQVLKHLHKCGALVLRCHLTTMGKQQEYMSTVYSDQLVSLASSLYLMLQNPAYNDMTALAENQDGIDVHLCIMRNRCPNLFKADDEAKADYKYNTESKAVWFSHMSTQALKLLLAYFYGRVYIEVPNEVRTELRDYATQNKLHHLERQLVDYPVHVGLGTEIVMEKATFKYGVRKVNFDDDDFPRNEMRFTPKHNPNASELIVTFYLARKNHYENYVNTSFKFSNPVEGVPIHLKCQFFLLDKKGNELLTSREYSHTFTDEEWSPPPTPPFATKGFCVAKKPHALKCDVRLSEMSYENLDSSDVSKVNPREVIPVFNNLYVLSDDLKRMYDKRSKCDLKIEVLEEEFFGHRSFLIRRSGLIRDKVEALDMKAPKKSTPVMVTIKLEGVSPYIFGKLMQYMYSGKIDIEDEEMAIAVDSTASYLRLPLLFEKLVTL